MTLTNTERLALRRLTRDPENGVTRKGFAEILGLSSVTAGGILNSLVQKGYAARTSAKRGTRFWRLRDYSLDLPDRKEIHSSSNLDDTISALQARAARADALEETLHKVLNVLCEAGIGCPQVETDNVVNLDAVLWRKE